MAMPRIGFDLRIFTRKVRPTCRFWGGGGGGNMDELEGAEKELDN